MHSMGWKGKSRNSDRQISRVNTLVATARMLDEDSQLQPNQRKDKV